MKIFHPKRIECSIFFNLGLFFLIPSIAFCWFYHTQMDAANFDSYNILDDALNANPRNEINMSFYQSENLHFRANGIQSQPVRLTTSISRGHVFSELFDVVYRIRRISRSSTIEYQTINFATVGNEVAFTIDALRIERLEQRTECSQSFSFNNNFTSYDPNSDTYTTHYLNQIHLKYYFHNLSDTAVYCGFTQDRNEYEATATNQITINIHYAPEILPYDFPAYSYIETMVAGFILFLVGIVGMLFFLWHCWSYKYVLIQRAILESGYHFER